MQAEVRAVKRPVGCASCAERRRQEERAHELHLAYARSPAPAPTVDEGDSEWLSIGLVIALLIGLLFAIRRNNQLADQVDELTREEDPEAGGEG